MPTKAQGKGAKLNAEFGDWSCRGCGYANFGRRSACRICSTKNASSATKPKGAGKGGASGELGAFAAKQLRAQADASKKLQRDFDAQKKELDKCKRQLEQARKASAAGTMAVDIGEDDDDDEQGSEEAREQRLRAELKLLEELCKLEGDDSPVYKAKAEGLRLELEAIKDNRDGPEGKVLSQAGRHAKELQKAKRELIKKRRQKEKVDDELASLKAEKDKLEERLEAKTKEAKDLDEAILAANGELQKLSQGAADAGAVSGPVDRAKRLGGELAPFVPEHLRPQLEIIIGAAAAFAEQQSQQPAPAAPQPPPQQPQGARSGDGTGAGTASSATTAPTATTTDASTDGGNGVVDADVMGDLDENTLQMLDEMYEAAQPTFEGKPVAAPPSEDKAKRRAKLLAVMGKRGALPARRGVLRDTKGKVRSAPVVSASAPAGAEE